MKEVNRMELEYILESFPATSIMCMLADLEEDLDKE